MTLINILLGCSSLFLFKMIGQSKSGFLLNRNDPCWHFHFKQQTLSQKHEPPLNRAVFSCIVGSVHLTNASNRIHTESTNCRILYKLNNLKVSNKFDLHRLFYFYKTFYIVLSLFSLSVCLSLSISLCPRLTFVEK